MRSFTLIIIILLFASGSSFGQYYKVYGKIVNSKLEPLAFVSVQVKEFQSGTTSKEDGSYELQLEPGKYDLAFTMVGYKSQLITIIVSQSDYKQNIILETDESK